MSSSMIDTFKNIEDLSAFARAQQKTLIDLLKKNKAQEEEIKHLKKLVEGAVPVINNKPVDFSSRDEESIAREQLFILKQKSTNEELTMEEAKKVEIYSKILNVIKGSSKTINAEARQVSTNELLQLVKQGENDTANG